MAWTGPDMPEVPWTQEEIALARQAGTTCPAVGERVLYRHVHHGDVTDAEVLEVLPVDELDINQRVCGDEPWVELVLLTGYGPVTAREARVRGSAGWLPLEWLVAA